VCKKFSQFCTLGWAGLWLVGCRYDADFKLDEKDWRHRTGAFAEGTFEKNLAVVDHLKKIASETDSTPAHLALKWLMSQPGVGSVIAGAKNVDQVSNNNLSDALTLTAEQLSAIHALTLDRVS
jgi:aryl-alcohol dehydrogenase-like predicted oxidoreductase